MIRFKHKGDFKHTESFFKKVRERSYLNTLKKYGQAGVDALASATPKDSGATAAAWSYEIVQTDGGYSIYWSNSKYSDSFDDGFQARTYICGICTDFTTV